MWNAVRQNAVFFYVPMAPPSNMKEKQKSRLAYEKKATNTCNPSSQGKINMATYR